MALTAEDLASIRAIVVQELDAREKRIGAVLADAFAVEVEKLRPSVVDWQKLAIAEIDKLRKAAADESRDISRALGRIDGKISPLGGRIGGLETRMKGVEKQLEAIVKTQGVVVGGVATVRTRVMGEEKPAVSDPPPSFDAELSIEPKTDAKAPATEAE